MKIHLPNSAFLGNIDQFLRSFDGSDPKNLKVTANDKWVSLHPVVLCMVAALGLTVKNTNIEIEAASKHYLERMGLFKFLKVNSGIIINEHEPAGKFIPITQIRDSNSLTDFITEMIPLLHLNPQQSESIRYIVSELVRNVLEHSLSEHGAIVSAQYYKKSNRISIGIVDTGVGIKTTINQSHEADTDLDALRLALTPGITGTTKREGGTERNAGAGLFFIKSIATVNKDFFMIYSGSAMYKLLKSKLDKLRLYADPFRDRHSKRSDFPFWQGTVVGIDITLDQTEEFSTLLDLIKNTYGEAVRERKKARYKAAQFI